MLPAVHRMRDSRDFDTAVRRGHRAGRPTLVVHATVVSPPVARVGFVVSRKVGSAVVRNRVKRRLRAVVHERLGRLPAGALVVVRANPAAATATSEVLATDLDVALARVLQAPCSRGSSGQGSRS